ncbi:MAG: hypothetical protein IT392_11325 [Nitrospirae bacterium]|nr:hypothetical protein [Nitrospirota bacterium]
MQKADSDFAGWLVCLPFTLRDQGGMVDRAIEVGSLFAEATLRTISSVTLSLYLQMLEDGSRLLKLYLRTWRSFMTMPG